MTQLLITGATSGIGMALTHEALLQGYQVIACGRNPDKLAQLGQYTTLKTLCFDVTDYAQCQQVLKEITADIYIFNAGTCEYVEDGYIDSQLFERVFRTNFMANIYMLEALQTRFTNQTHLIFVDSLARLLPFTRSQAYGASKAALRYFANCLAVDLKSKGIKVTSVSPGFVKTPLTDRNNFSMPMRISAEQAARHLLQGIQAGKNYIHFPFIFSCLLRILAWLPESLQVRLCDAMKADNNNKGTTE